MLAMVLGLAFCYGVLLAVVGSPGAYRKLVKTQEPALIVLLIDMSPSMLDPLTGTAEPKIVVVGRLLTPLFNEILARCTEEGSEGTVVKSRYYFLIIVYDQNAEVFGSGIMDIQTTVAFFSQNKLAMKNPTNGTNTKGALELAYQMIKDEVADGKFKNSTPPVIFVVSDAESQSSPVAASQQLRSLRTDDGNGLVGNLLIGMNTTHNHKTPEEFVGYVSIDEMGASQHNRDMFESSSEMPESMHQYLVSRGFFPNMRPGSKLLFDIRSRELFYHAIQVVGSGGAK